jgi:hypothetical protein
VEPNSSDSYLLDLVIDQNVIKKFEPFLLINTSLNNSNRGVINEVWIDEVLRKMWVNDENSIPQRGSDLLLRLPNLDRATNIVSSMNRGSVRIVGASEESVTVAHFTRCVERPLVIINEVQKGEVW